MRLELERKVFWVTDEYALATIFLFSSSEHKLMTLLLIQTGEHIATSRVFFDEQAEPLLVEGALVDRKIVQISSGQQHSVALDSEGYVYSWGTGGSGRTGLGVQMDVLTPTQVPTFSGENVLTRCGKIAAGSTNTLFIDNQGMVLLCGKFKTTGDGSVGQVSYFARMSPRSHFTRVLLSLNLASLAS